MSSIISSSHLVNGTQSTPDEYRRVDKWRCFVADECVAELKKLNIADSKPKRSRSSRAGSVRDDSLVLYDPKAREEVFEDYDKSGRPITVIRRYKSVKEPSTRKPEPQVVEVTVEQSSSRSSDHSHHPRTEEVRLRHRPRDRTSMYRNNGTLDSVGRQSHRSRHEPSSREISDRKSEQVTSSKKDVLRRMLKLNDSEITSHQREDSSRSRSKRSRDRTTTTESRSRARSYDGRNIYTRRIPRNRAAESRQDPTDDARQQPYYYDLRDARRQGSRADDDNREYDRRSTYSMPRRSRNVNRGYDTAVRRSYDRRSVVDEGYVEGKIDEIHRRVERFQVQPSSFSYEPSSRRSRRASAYDDYDY